MGVELLLENELGTKVYLPAVKEGIEWTTERKNTPGKLSFEVLKDDALDFSEGSAVRMKENGDDEAYATGKIPENHFSELLTGYDTEQKTLDGEIERLQAEIDRYNTDSVRADKFIELVKRRSSL